MSGSPSALEIRNLTVRYGDGGAALEQVSLSVRRGEILALIGPNGAGKSTLFKTVLGLVKPASGEVVFAEHFSRATTGYVPQMAALDRNLPFSVMELLTLNLPRQRFWFGGGAHRQRALAKLELLDGAKLADRGIHELSGGEFQKVMIAGALLRNPRLLILDEPSTGVDHAGTHMLERLIIRLRDEEALTVMLASHDLHLVQLVADRVCCLNREICGLGPADEVLDNHYLKGFWHRKL
ncbi:MAG: metal ABC transporter ATP-binding protein [Verrucomicrobiales bacterium]|jgi:zinc transport system ATP-binding protein|nr:metal ABC transporter ATP-binding protein [Verrucomicrobiales bacterium]